MNKIFVLTFQTLIFEIPFPFESLTLVYTYIPIPRSSIIHPSFYLLWAYLHVITSQIIHPIRAKFRFAINIDQSGSQPVEKRRLKIFYPKFRYPTIDIMYRFRFRDRINRNSKLAISKNFTKLCSWKTSDSLIPRSSIIDFIKNWNTWLISLSGDNLFPPDLPEFFPPPSKKFTTVISAPGLVSIARGRIDDEVKRGGRGARRGNYSRLVGVKEFLYGEWGQDWIFLKGGPQIATTYLWRRVKIVVGALISRCAWGIFSFRPIDEKKIYNYQCKGRGRHFCSLVFSN